MASKIAIVVDGREFVSIKQAADHFGVSLQTAARRLRNGWAAEQALGLHPAPRRRHAGREVVTSAGRFPSVVAAAEHFRIDPSLLASRLDAGWRPDEAVDLEAHARPPVVRTSQHAAASTVEVEFGERVFPNLAEFARHFGLAPDVVRKRLARGWSKAQAVEVETAPPRLREKDGTARTHAWREVATVDNRAVPSAAPGEFKLYLITNAANGHEYVGITVTPLDTRLRGHRAAARNGMKSKLYNAMRRYGIANFKISLLRSDAKDFAELQHQEVEEISRRGTVKSGYNISPGGSIGTASPIKVGTMTFPSRAAAAAYFGIDDRVFNLRLGRLKWSAEQAAEIDPRPKYARRKVSVQGKAFPSLQAAAKHYGVGYKLAHQHVLMGWSVEQALGLAPPPPGHRLRNQQVSAFGRTFVNLVECANFFGIKAESLRQRVKNRGDELEQAIAYLQSKPRPGARKKPAIVDPARG